MKTFLILIGACFVFGCTCNPALQPKEEIEYLNREVPPSLKTFVDTLQKLERDAPQTINHAIKLFEVIVPADSLSADSATVNLINFIYTVVERENETLQKDTSNYAALLNADAGLTEKQKNKKNTWTANLLLLRSDSEGGAYLVPAYDLFLSRITTKTSGTAKSYLELLAAETLQPTLGDASVAISMEELTRRLLASESLLSKRLPSAFSRDLQRHNKFYNSIILFGSDNTPALAGDGKTIEERFQWGWDNLIKNNPNSVAAGTVREWLAIIKSGNTAAIETFRKKYTHY